MQVFAIFGMHEPLEVRKQVVGHVGPEFRAKGKWRPSASLLIERAGGGIPETAVERMQHAVIGPDIHHLAAVQVFREESLVSPIIIYEVVVFGRSAHHGGR